jgi:hypothetical protein
MEFTVEPTMTESESSESADPLDTPASTEVEEGQEFQTKGAHRIYVSHVSYLINTSIALSRVLGDSVHMHIEHMGQALQGEVGIGATGVNGPV